MNVLVLNCGSSTLKFALFGAEMTAEGAVAEQQLARGVVDQIGRSGKLQVRVADGGTLSPVTGLTSHEDAIRAVLDWLRSSGLTDRVRLSAIGHRVVHGGDRFSGPIKLSDEVVRELEGVTELAPLHNRPALDVIRTCCAVLGTEVPMVAVFDTAFHATLPPRARNYAIPAELARQYAVQRYGFHGLAHRFMTERCAVLLGLPLNRLNAITLQLGNGSSATAIQSGLSVETSMGLTPLEGLMMGTRSGNVDPALVGHLMRRAELSIEQVEVYLTARSGLLGVSGLSHDMRCLLEAEKQGDERAALAIEMFCYRARQYVGAYLAILGGAQAVVFGGGIGENAPEVRARICGGMNWCGLELDQERNNQAVDCESLVSTERSAIKVFVVPVNEERLILRDILGSL